MSGNTYGKLFTVTTAGESHGPALVAIVDGCPPGLVLSLEDLQRDLDRRKHGTSMMADDVGSITAEQCKRGRNHRSVVTETRALGCRVRHAEARHIWRDHVEPGTRERGHDTLELSG